MPLRPKVTEPWLSDADARHPGARRRRPDVALRSHGCRRCAACMQRRGRLAKSRRVIHGYYMATRTVRLDEESERALADVLRATGTSVSGLSDRVARRATHRPRWVSCW